MHLFVSLNFVTVENLKLKTSKNHRALYLFVKLNENLWSRRHVDVINIHFFFFFFFFLYDRNFNLNSHTYVLKISGIESTPS
jgi:hypothetical protein